MASDGEVRSVIQDLVAEAFGQAERLAPLGGVDAVAALAAARLRYYALLYHTMSDLLLIEARRLERRPCAEGLAA